ncbi:hypothetical protein LCGC14_0350220 [marine sediment metagenome]|uniref:Uncharacterized protein n=1 Tax=marine sediment metagenome TaxID=412755 RepID=A0A0F9TB72_9ZZZZ
MKYKITMQVLMLLWGICLMTIPAFEEIGGYILGTIWIVGSIIVGAIPNK